jgi:hypothetical protein
MKNKFYLTLISILIFISFLISILSEVNFATFLIVNFLFFISFILLIFILKNLINFNLKIISLNKEKIMENPYIRKTKIIENAIKGSKFARVYLSQLLKNYLELKYDIKLNKDLAKEILKEEKFLALIFYDEYEKYFKSKVEYENILKEFLTKY